jgi:hypothetical protein
MSENIKQFTKIVRVIEVTKDGKTLYLKSEDVSVFHSEFTDNPIDARFVTSEEYEDVLESVAYPGKESFPKCAIAVDSKPLLVEFEIVATKAIA